MFPTAEEADKLSKESRLVFCISFIACGEEEDKGDKLQTSGGGGAVSIAYSNIVAIKEAINKITVRGHG